jgi:hypothetical protein
MVKTITNFIVFSIGLMGMEALETVVEYWEDALSAYKPQNGRNNVLLGPEESLFIKSLEELLEEAYKLQVTLRSYISSNIQVFTS